MADSIREVNWLRFYYTSEDAVKDKDLLKNEAHIKLTHKVNALMAVPLFFQVWHLGLINHASKVSLMRKVRMFKLTSFVGAAAIGGYELINMRKQWTFYDRFYPEPTELQKGLTRDAMIYKEQAFA
jgi:hypothetical protein